MATNGRKIGSFNTNDFENPSGRIFWDFTEVVFICQKEYFVVQIAIQLLNFVQLVEGIGADDCVDSETFAEIGCRIVKMWSR